MEQNRITDKDLQMILDYFKQFQMRLSEMNLDDLILRLEENRLTEKEKQEIIEDFAEVRCVVKRQFVPTKEEIKELLGEGENGEFRGTLEEFNKNMDEWPLLHKKRGSLGLTPEQIDQVIKITRDKQWWEMTEAEKKEILGNIPFL